MLASSLPVAAPYRGLFALPVLRRLAVADKAWLPQGMVSITLLLVAAQHASMTVAGLVVAGYTLGQASTAPLRGRLADRRGLVPVAAVCGIGYALALLALLAAALARGPAGLLVGAAAAAGLVNPPLSPGLRSLWSAHAGPQLKQAAFAGRRRLRPRLYHRPGAGQRPGDWLRPGRGPRRAARADRCGRPGHRQAIPPPRPPGPAARSGRLPEVRSRPLRSGALRDLLVTAALVNAALSGCEVALTAYVRHHHAPWASGPLLAEVSVGSILGSLLLGAKGSAAGSRPDRLRPAASRLRGGLAVLTAAGLYAPLLAVAAPLPACASARRWPPCSGPRPARRRAAAAPRPRPGSTRS